VNLEFFDLSDSFYCGILKSSEENMFSRKFGKLILTLAITIMLISACGGTDVSPTPTEANLDAIYTAAAATVFAGQTGTAGAQPTKTFTPTATVSLTPTVTGTPAPTRALVLPAPVIVLVNTITGTPWTLTPGAVGGNNSALVQDVAVPNMKAGESFTKTWVIKNAGTATWNAGYKITFIGGNTLGRDNSTKIFKTVSPGATYTQNLGFTAPNAPGTYTGSWQLATDKGILFGAIFKVVVIVPGATNTPTSAVATPSKTSAPTETPTPTKPPVYPNP
jgi:hypothetical protein